jgi:hypothetical protein
MAGPFRLALKWSDVDWLTSKLHVGPGIVRQRLDDVKTDESGKHMTVCNDLLEVFKV